MVERASGTTGPFRPPSRNRSTSPSRSVLHSTPSVMLNSVQHPWRHGSRASDADGAPWTLNQVQGDGKWGSWRGPAAPPSNVGLRLIYPARWTGITSPDPPRRETGAHQSRSCRASVARMARQCRVSVASASRQCCVGIASASRPRRRGGASCRQTGASTAQAPATPREAVNLVNFAGRHQAAAFLRSAISRLSISASRKASSRLWLALSRGSQCV